MRTDASFRTLGCMWSSRPLRQTRSTRTSLSRGLGGCPSELGQNQKHTTIGRSLTKRKFNVTLLEIFDGGHWALFLVELVFPFGHDPGLGIRSLVDQFRFTCRIKNLLLRRWVSNRLAGCTCTYKRIAHLDTHVHLYEKQVSRYTKTLGLGVNEH